VSTAFQLSFQFGLQSFTLLLCRGANNGSLICRQLSGLLGSFLTLR
jgi:hypothetical protein